MANDGNDTDPSLEYLLSPRIDHGLHRSRTAPVMAEINDLTHPINEKPDRKSTVRKAVALFTVALFIAYLSLGALIYWLNRDNYVVNPTHPVVDDLTRDSVVTKLLSILFVLVGFIFIEILLSWIVSHVQNRRFMYDAETGRMRMGLKVGLALGVVVLSLGFGVLIMHFVEKTGWLDSFYFSIVSVTTVGYGDRAFKTLPGRLLSSIWLIVSTLAIVRVFSYWAEARLDKRNREMAKKVLGANMSMAEFFAADIDSDGYLSISEYVIYQLKLMQKINAMDIIQITNQFNKLDRTNTGKITLLDLLETNTNNLSTAISVSAPNIYD